VTRALALALLLCGPGWAVAQSPSWEEILGAADRAWEGGQVEDAERLYAAAINKAECFGESDLRLARSLAALGVFYREQGRYRDASPLFGRALALTEKALPPGDPGLVPALNDLGAAWLQQGLASPAEPLFRRSMAIAEQALGPDDPSTATSMAGLAAVYQAPARFAEAEQLYRGAIRIYEKTLGRADPVSRCCGASRAAGPA